MKIQLDNPAQMLSHFLLENAEVAKAVSKTEDWTERDTITATIFMNGVEVPAETFEAVLQNFWGQIERRFEEKYASDEARAEELLKAKASALLEKMADVSYELENLDVHLKRY